MNGALPDKNIRLKLSSWIQENGGFPSNVKAEEQLLGSAFWSYHNLQKVCEEVSKDVFSSDKCRLLFDVLHYLYLEKKPVDVTTVTAEIMSRGQLNEIGVPFIEYICQTVPTGEHVSYFIESVMEKYTLRKMMETAVSIISNVKDPDIPVGEVLENAEKGILNISKFRKTSEFRDVKEVLEKAKNDLDALAKNDGVVTGVTTGLTDLDNLTNGFRPTQLIIIAARPAVGKTAFALNIACEAAKSFARTSKKSIAIFSLEMPAEQLIMRMISSLGSVDNKKLQTGKMLDTDWNGFTQGVSQLMDTKIYFHDAGGVTASEIKAKCRRLAAQEEGLGLVIIDYLQLIDSPARSSGNRQQEVSDISRSLKTMALELEVPVIALSQLSRSVEKRDDKKPVLSDLRESGSIEQDADIVAALHAPAPPKDPVTGEEIPIDDRAPQKIELIILKHRNGPIATIELKFVKRFSKFRDVDSNKGTGGEKDAK